jgi:nitrate/TMAO reductase-like tetraheme cytochrome c subunit
MTNSSSQDLLLPQTTNSPASAGTSNDLLQNPGGTPPTPEPAATTTPTPPPAQSMESAAEAHEAMLVENKFPSASTCATCHPTQFRQWSVSQHAYAQMSPVFNSMQATINRRTSGSNGDFCIRCHTQVGMILTEPIFASNLDRHATSREGITCIVCHRVKENYGKVSGRMAINEGDIFDPVYGPKGDKNLKYVLAHPDEFPVVSKRGDVGRAIHGDVVKFDPLEKSGFCGTCHDVNLLNGFRLEEAFSQFKNSPANKRGETCQDCHMGKIPGIKSGYAFGPAAIIGDKPTPPRKLTNHMFAGPDYSIIHPGMFPHNTQAQALASLREWLLFDYEAGWGTDAFENNLPAGYVFPAKWQSIDDRYQARGILQDQFALLEDADQQRYQLLRRGFQLGDFVLEKNNRDGIEFRVNVVNGTDGHGVPTGFDAERINFLQVTVTDSRGKAIFKSGDRDPNGDVRDTESDFVHNFQLPFDDYLFSLQSKFLVTQQRGGEREQPLPTNKSVDPLPYVRPSISADVLLGTPFGARKQTVGIPPSGHRWAPYAVDSDALTGFPPYKVNIKFITQMVPINLISDIAAVGFDYNMSGKETAKRIIERSELLWDKTIVLPDKPETISLKPSEKDIMAPPPKPFMPGITTAKMDEKTTEMPLTSAH